MIPFPAHLQQTLDTAWKTVRAHAARMEVNPLEAMHWINAAIEAAAQVHVLEIVRTACIESGTEARNITQESLLAFVAREIDNRSTCGMVRSTALLDGPLQAEELRAWTMVRKAFVS